MESTIPAHPTGALSMWFIGKRPEAARVPLSDATAAKHAGDPHEPAAILVLEVVDNLIIAAWISRQAFKL